MARRQGLHYTGTDPEHWIPGVPASDHNQIETDTVHVLVESGLYERRTVVDEPESEARESEPAEQPETWPAELEPVQREPYWWLPPQDRPDADADEPEAEKTDVGSDVGSEEADTEAEPEPAEQTEGSE